MEEKKISNRWIYGIGFIIVLFYVFFNLGLAHPEWYFISCFYNECGLKPNEYGDSFGSFNALIGCLTLIGLALNYILLKNQIVDEKEKAIALEKSQKIDRLNQNILNLTVEILKEYNTVEMMVNILNVRVNAVGGRSSETKMRTLNEVLSELLNENNFSDGNHELTVNNVMLRIGTICELTTQLIKIQITSGLEEKEYSKQNLHFIPYYFHRYYVEYLYRFYWFHFVMTNIETDENGKFHTSLIIFLFENHNDLLIDYFKWSNIETEESKKPRKLCYDLFTNYSKNIDPKSTLETKIECLLKCYRDLNPPIKLEHS